MGGLNEATVSADPVKLIIDNVKLEGRQLFIKNVKYDLSKVGRMFVIGAGKRCAQMAYGIERVLEDRITEGYVSFEATSRSCENGV
ncbi:MAG: DUF4147 domain-containing protein [Candidatus Bathyarchaeia archaeon]